MGVRGRVEWPTLGLILATYAVWFALALTGGSLPAPLWIAATALVTTLYWSIVHEVVHGHPTRHRILNFALVWLPIGWVYSLLRFRDGHLAHHATGELTDPFDDPESWYTTKAAYASRGPLVRAVLTANNTVLGRLTIGPAVTLTRMILEDVALIAGGGKHGRRALRAWLLHLPGVLALAAVLAAFSPVPAWQFAVATYFGVALLLLRTFLEHQAAETAHERTVIIEDRGPLAFLFLNNNLHAAHHLRPGLAWYRLPEFYARHGEELKQRNGGYVFRSYGEVIGRYLVQAKEPVAHPLRG